MKAFRRTAIVAAAGGLMCLPFLGILRSALASAALLVVLVAWNRAPAVGGLLAGAWAPPIPGRLRGTWVPAALILVSFVVPPFLNSYTQDILVSMGFYIILSLGLNVHVGLAGMLNLGFIAFYAVGAYTHALLSTRLGLSFWPDLALSGIFAGAAGFLLCLPTLRLRGDYLAIVTLGFGEMVRIILNNWDSLTGGPNGVLGVSSPSLLGAGFTTPLQYYYLVLALVLIAVFFTGRLINSRIGRAWMAIREDETAAEVMGVNTSRMKLLAFSVGAVYAGIAGALFAAKQGFVSPESFTFLESILVLCMVVLGGMGSLSGPILGAAVLVLLPEVLREFHFYRMLIFGGALVAMMIYRPQGLLGTRRA